MTDLSDLRTLTAGLNAAMYNWSEEGVRKELNAIMAKDMVVHMCHPFGDMPGDQYYESVLAKLHFSLPDVEKRPWIIMAGTDDHEDDWVGIAGTYIGTFVKPFLDIQPTGHLAHMRFHEYYKIKNEKIIEIQAIWDIPELMMQAGAWPMAPSLGREGLIPGPATCDGLQTGDYQHDVSTKSKILVIDMLTAMSKHPEEPQEAMEMPRYWHPKMNWYGPAGIGTARGISGFRNWHQMPFLMGMPDRGSFRDELTYHFFADGPYVAVTGWPNMKQTLSDDGWMGIAPSGRMITLRSLDFWRIERGQIRENWVLVDLLDVYRQLGVDVLGRMRTFNKARATGSIPIMSEVAS